MVVKRMRSSCCREIVTAVAVTLVVGCSGTSWLWSIRWNDTRSITPAEALSLVGRTYPQYKRDHLARIFGEEAFEQLLGLRWLAKQPDDIEARAWIEKLREELTK